MAKERLKKVTVLLPEDLLRKARRVSRSGITPTIRKSLQVYAARDAYEGLRKLRGKVKFGLSWEKLRGDE